MIRLRNPFTNAFGLVLSLGLGAALCWVMWDPGVDHSLVSRVTAGLVVGANIWFIWRVAGHPAVLVSDTGVMVRNPFRPHAVPWNLLGEVTVSDGLRFTVGGPEPIRASARPAVASRRAATTSVSVHCCWCGRANRCWPSRPGRWTPKHPRSPSSVADVHPWVSLLNGDGATACPT